MVYVVCNNAMYRILKLNMDLYRDFVKKDESPGGGYPAMDFLVRPDFAGIAEAMGVRGRRVASRRCPLSIRTKCGRESSIRLHLI